MCHYCFAALQKFDELGFIIHPEKSVFNPSQTITLLGFIINSVKMTITLTDEKRAEIKQICNAIVASDNVKIRDLAQLIGLGGKRRHTDSGQRGGQRTADMQIRHFLSCPPFSTLMENADT